MQTLLTSAKESQGGVPPCLSFVKSARRLDHTEFLGMLWPFNYEHLIRREISSFDVSVLVNFAKINLFEFHIFGNFAK